MSLDNTFCSCQDAEHGLTEDVLELSGTLSSFAEMPHETPPEEKYILLFPILFQDAEHGLTEDVLELSGTLSSFAEMPHETPPEDEVYIIIPNIVPNAFWNRHTSSASPMLMVADDFMILIFPERAFQIHMLQHLVRHQDMLVDL